MVTVVSGSVYHRYKNFYELAPRREPSPVLVVRLLECADFCLCVRTYKDTSHRPIQYPGNVTVDYQTGRVVCRLRDVPQDGLGKLRVQRRVKASIGDILKAPGVLPNGSRPVVCGHQTQLYRLTITRPTVPAYPYTVSRRYYHAEVFNMGDRDNTLLYHDDLDIKTPIDGVPDKYKSKIESAVQELVETKRRLTDRARNYGTARGRYNYNPRGY